MPLTQDFRSISVSSPLGKDVLLFNRLNGREELGRLFDFSLNTLSRKSDIRANQLLGQSVMLEMTRPDGATRYLHGLVTQFGHEGIQGDLTRYHMTLKPWLWFLTRTADCRIFQKKSAPDIIKQVFKELGYSDFKDSLVKTYKEREYCVQYRESDFNFVSRLMEEEGIYYYFQHEAGRHTLVMADSASAHAVAQGYESIPYFPPENTARRERDHISSWRFSQEVQPGAFSLRDYDFEKPRADLEVKSNHARSHSKSDYECYDYPGGYCQTADGQTLADTRLEELQSHHERFLGEGNAAGLCVGNLFKLTGHTRQDQNADYLIQAMDFQLASNEYSPETIVGGFEGYQCAFSAIPKNQVFRPARLTPKPFVQGPQTAVVVGKSGEEIWTDKYGRVKVKFHWDRSKPKDETSSCWIRVSHPWAGKNWGMIALPRIGQEVIVDFLEGDPDRPIITGRVYNAEQMPPYALPANATQSGILSRSSQEGSPSQFNELRFEDKKGSEEVYFHAEKDMNVVAEHDHSLDVGHDKLVKVGNDAITDVQNNRTTTVDQGDDTLNVKFGNQITQVDLGCIQMEALQKIELKVGQNTIVIDQTGIAINGLMFKAEGMTMAEIKSVMTSISGSAMLTAKGGVIAMN